MAYGRQANVHQRANGGVGRRVTGALLLVCGLAALSVQVAYPDLFGALWTRLQYSHEDRLIDAAQYRFTVPITRGATQPREYSVVPATRAGHATTLRQMATRTSSNIVLLTRDGELLFEAYAARPDADATMLTNSMSMAKTLVSLLVGIAVERAVIRSVDQPIGQLLKELDGDARGKISIKHLLRMESGLASQNAGFPLTHLQSMYFGDSPDARALSVPAVQPPGVSFDYNSVNTQLLLIILQRHLGGGFEELLSRHIWGPLGLDTGFGWRASATGDAKGFCCVFATARAWASIGRLFLDIYERQHEEPAIVSQQWLQEMIEPSATNSGYGYHIYVRKTTDRKASYVSMEGTPQQFVMVFPMMGIIAVSVGDESPEFSVEDFVSAIARFRLDLDPRLDGSVSELVEQ